MIGARSPYPIVVIVCTISNELWRNYLNRRAPKFIFLFKKNKTITKKKEEDKQVMEETRRRKNVPQLTTKWSWESKRTCPAGPHVQTRRRWQKRRPRKGRVWRAAWATQSEHGKRFGKTQRDVTSIGLLWELAMLALNEWFEEPERFHSSHHQCILLVIPGFHFGRSDWCRRVQSRA